MKNVFLTLLLVFTFVYTTHLVNAQQQITYFDKYPDEYSPSYLPEIIPSSATKEDSKNKENDVLIGQLQYKWKETDPNGNECSIILCYSRYTPATTRYGYGAFVNYGLTVKPQEAAYYEAYLRAGYDLSYDWDIVEIKGIPQEHIPKYYGPNNPDTPRIIISSLKKMKSIPQGYVIYFKNPYNYAFTSAYANINLYVITVGGVLKNPKAGWHHEYWKNRVKEIGTLAYNKLAGIKASATLPLQSQESYAEQPKEQPKIENIPVKATAMPSAMGDEMWSTAYLPATNLLPAKIIAQTKPNTTVQFHIVKSPKDAYLAIGNNKGTTLETKSDSKGVAEALFYYNGGEVKEPKKYDIKVSTGEEKDTATVYVGLGLAFDKINAVKGAYGDRHPFTLSMKSKHFPKLNLGLYFSSASRQVWNGQTVGIRLKLHWVNKEPNLPADKAFDGITKITPVMVGSGKNNVLTVLSYTSGEETVYNITKYSYPAVKMMSDGFHNYRIVGELVLIDQEGRNLGRLNEKLIQSDAFAVVSKERPEHFMVSLVCAFEAQNVDQFLILEFIKKFPVYGNYADEFLNATGLLCRLGKAEYEGLFYDLNNYLGGKWIDHLSSKEVFYKLTPRQQKAVQWVKAGLESAEHVKTKREYTEKVIDNNIDPDLFAPTSIKDAEESSQKIEKTEQKSKPAEIKLSTDSSQMSDKQQQSQSQNVDPKDKILQEEAVKELQKKLKKFLK